MTTAYKPPLPQQTPFSPMVIQRPLSPSKNTICIFLVIAAIGYNEKASHALNSYIHKVQYRPRYQFFQPTIPSHAPEMTYALFCKKQTIIGGALHNAFSQEQQNKNNLKNWTLTSEGVVSTRLGFVRPSRALSPVGSRCSNSDFAHS